MWLTADGIPVLDHDGVVRIGRRRRRITDVAREDLPAHVPALAELFRECGTSYELSLDLKHPEAGPAVVDLVRSVAPELLRHLWLCHPDVAALITLRPYDDEVRLVNSCRLSKMKEGPERRAARLAGEGVDAVNMHHTDWTGGLAALFHRFERVSFGWDMQSDHVLRPALRMGLDGVFSDHVDVMVDAFRTELGAQPDQL